MRKTINPERKHAPTGLHASTAAVTTLIPSVFPIIGIGTSSGGLEGFKDFFSGMAEEMDPDSAIILVQHQAPAYGSLLAELIEPCTRMKVLEAVDGVKVQRNHVYVAPAGKEIALRGGSLHLSDFTEPPDRRLPLDFFLRSLAVELGSKAIGIVLAGCASDGTEGARAIRKAGGRVIVQSPASTGSSKPPVSVIKAGLADHEMEPAEMPTLLLKLLCQDEEITSTRDDSTIKNILKLLLVSTGYDFTHYKQNSIRRALVRRMSDCSIPLLADYETHLQRSPVELNTLFHQLLVGVTWFFRDSEAFRMLSETLSKTMVARPPGEDVIRVWIAGCSTGEEAYSIAILLTEVRETLHLKGRLQVFATDIDATAVAAARAGVYPAGISSLISPDRLARYFTALPDGGHRIKKSIREVVVFSVHSLIKDPPFSKLDLIVCRNVLIYLDTSAQKRIFSLFHSSLKPSAIMMLGTSESVGDQHSLFATLDRKAKIYQRKQIGSGINPAGIGRTEASPEPLSSEPTDKAPRSAASGVQPEIPNDAATDGPDRPADPPTIAALQQELRAQDLELNETSGKLRNSDEDRISSNEEQESINQELLSTNEELEVSKDQLQSTNEELASLNAELQAKIFDLSAAKDDISNLLDCTGIGTVFVDSKLRILRFNPLISRTINLIPADVGRPMVQITSKLTDCGDLAAEVGAVLKTLIGSEREVKTREGLSFLMRIHPYRTLDGRIEGAVISFAEITEMVNARDTLKQANSLHRLAVVIHDAHDAVIMHDLDGRILAWNPGAARMYGWSEEEALGMNMRTMIPENLHQQELGILRKLGQAEVLEPYATRRLTKSGGLLAVSLIATPLVNEVAEVYAIATTERTISGGER